MHSERGNDPSCHARISVHKTFESKRWSQRELSTQDMLSIHMCLRTATYCPCVATNWTNICVLFTLPLKLKARLWGETSATIEHAVHLIEIGWPVEQNVFIEYLKNNIEFLTGFNQMLFSKKIKKLDWRTDIQFENLTNFRIWIAIRIS